MPNSKSTLNITLSTFLVVLSAAVVTATVDLHKTIKRVNGTIEQVQNETLPKVNDLLDKINQVGPDGQPGLVGGINQLVQEINTVIKQLNGTELAGERAVLYQTVAQINILLAQLNHIPPAAGEEAINPEITQILNSLKQALSNAADITGKINDRITDDSSLQKAFLWNGRNDARNDDDSEDPESNADKSNPGWFGSMFDGWKSYAETTTEAK